MSHDPSFITDVLVIHRKTIFILSKRNKPREQTNKTKTIHRSSKKTLTRNDLFKKNKFFFTFDYIYSQHKQFDLSILYLSMYICEAIP